MPRSPRSSRLVGTMVSLALALSVTDGLLAARPAAPSAQDARSRERGMYVSVVDRNGVPVTNLSARDFIVREDGVRREVLAVEQSSDPITIALVVDNSDAARSVIPDLRRSLKAFVERMGGHNPIAVTATGDRPTILQDYTLVVPQLVQGVERIFPQPGSGSYLLQSLREVANGFAKRDFDRGVILTITTEGPEFSDLDYRQVLPDLRESGAAMEALVFTFPNAPDPRADSVRNRAAILDVGPRETGGRRDDLLSSMAIDGALQKLADRLLQEYRITYSRPETLIPPQRIEVSVTRPGLDARGTPIRPKRG